VGATALRSGRTYWFFEAPTDRFDGAEPLAVVNGRRWPEPWPSIVAATSPEGVLVHAIRTVRPLTAWHRGRVAVLGDAAHAMEPNLAQGAAQAIEDAAALLTALETHQDLPEALSVYAGARRDRATMMQRESGRMARLALNRHTRARDLLLRVTPQPVRARMIKRLLTA
jgi:2-polyprenyl-6-methoxyphenol hydroxylase-like FAD-dependent oxidoreductase